MTLVMDLRVMRDRRWRIEIRSAFDVRLFHRGTAVWNGAAAGPVTDPLTRRA